MNGDRIIVQWMLLSIPTHPFTAHALVNSVEVIRHLYFKQNILSFTVFPSEGQPAPEGQAVRQSICATGPVLFSVTVRQICAEYGGKATTILGHRSAGIDYEEIGAHWKAPGFTEDSEHHPGTDMHQHDAQLLNSYAS